MKKITLNSIRKSVLFLIILFASNIAKGQCINPNPFASVFADNTVGPQYIAFCFQPNNYNTIDGLIVGGDYVFAVETSAFTAGYVTITTDANVVIAHGPSPLTVNDIAVATVRFHSSDNAACASSDCYTSYLEYIPSCPQPSNLSITNIATTLATANWSAGGTETLWDLEYGLNGFTQGEGTVVTNLNAPNYLFTSLLPGTTYQFYVKANCSISDQSFWSGPYTFTTFCNTVTEFYENFDAVNANQGLMPDCWLRSTEFSFNVQVESGSLAPASAPNYLRLFSWGGDSYAFMPPVSNLNAGSHRLRFSAFSSELDTVLKVGYFTNPNDLSTFVVLDTLILPFGDPSTTQAYTIVPGVLPAGVTVLAFKYTPGDGFTGPAYIDDVRWEPNTTCLEPVLAFAINVTDSTAALVWNAGSTETEWEVQYGLQNFTLGTGTTISVINTQTYALAGLTPNTIYEYYVRAKCAGNITSGWSIPYSFKTDCTPVTQFTENFDTTNPWSGLMPECWVKAGNSFFNEVISGSTMSEPNYLNMSGEDPISTSYAIMPSVSNLQAGTHRLRFRAISDNANAIIEVGYLTNINDVSTFVSLSEFQVGAGSNGNITDFSITPTGIPSGIKNLVFKNPGIPGQSTNFQIDDVRWEAIPVCQEPTQLSLVLNGISSATLGWETNGTATQWQIQYGASGFEIGTGTVVTATTNPYVLTNLTSNTLYQFYVRSVCSTTENSVWTGPFQFRTLCDEVTEFIENFDSTNAWEGLIPSCWSRGTNNTFSNAVISDSNMSAPNCLLMEGFSEFAEIYTVMPAVSNLQANTHRLRFRAQGNGFDSGTLKLGYMTNLNDIATFVLLQEFLIPANTSIIDFFYTPTTIPVGIKNFVLRNTGSVNGSLSVRIDDVKWELLPTAAPVCTDGLTASVDPDCGTAPVTLSWNPAPFADQYRITIGTTPGGSEILNNVEIGSGTSYIFQTPTAATTYYWTVIPYNPIGFPSTCTSATFVTPNGLCYCVPQYSVGKTLGDLISNVVITGTTLANNSGTSPVNPAYTLFVGQPNYTTILQGGQSYSMTVSVGTYGNQNVSVWIDANSNGNYEESERVGYSVLPIDESAPGVFTIDVPCITTTGLFRMRVRDVYFIPGDLIDPCLEYNYGETEDYIVTITAAPLPAIPTGDALQTINVNNAAEATIEDLVVTGTNVQWFATESDALSGTNPLSNDTVLTNGSVYYAISSSGTCLSAPLAVTVTVTLGVNDFDTANFKYYPNPVTDILSISYSNTISQVVVYNLVGQQVVINYPNNPQVQLDLSKLNAGTYLIKIDTEVGSKTFKIIKF